MHILKSIANMGSLEGYIHYDGYLSDNDFNHDILIGIGHKAFAPEEYNSEEERLDILLDLWEESIDDNADRAYNLLNC